jgi:hypothetical protein
MTDTTTPNGSFELTPPKVLLMGGAGSGKTHSFGTLVDWARLHEHRVFALFTENGLETLLKYYSDKGTEIPHNLHWHVVKTKPAGLKSLVKAANDVGKNGYEQLSKMIDPDRHKNNVYLQIVGTLGNYVDQRTGKEFGSMDEDWTERDWLALDSLTELSTMAMKMQIGTKPTAALPDYMVAQVNLMNLLRLMTNGTRCGVAMTAHPVREKDEVTGSVRLMPRTIGSAIASELSPLFSEVISTIREGDKWYWDTANSSADLKTRYLPISTKIRPDFAQICDPWLKAATAAKSGHLEDVK